MPVSPEQLRSLRFDEGIRGYDKRQVDKVIQRVADLVEDLEARLSDAERRATGGTFPSPTEGEAAELDETLRRTLILAQRTADAAVKEARDEAARIRDEAQAEADELLDDARRKNQHVVDEVDAERSRLLAEARQECEATVARVQDELARKEQALRDQLVEQIDELTKVRDVLVDDIERLEAHVTARREGIRAALDELGSVLDDPDKLRAPVAGAPELAPAPELEGYEPVEVRVEAMDELPGSSPAPELSGDDGAEVEVDAGPPTEAHPVIDLDQVEDGSADGFGATDEPARPAWADAVPPRDDAEPAGALAGSARRAVSAGDDPEAMDRFFSDADDERRSGWFRRKV